MICPPISLERWAGYEVQGSYVPVHLLPYCKTWVQKCLSHAEPVWSDLIELPCEPEVSFVHVERSPRSLNGFFRIISSDDPFIEKMLEIVEPFNRSGPTSTTRQN